MSFNPVDGKWEGCKDLTGLTVWSFITPDIQWPEQPDNKVIADAIVAWIGWDGVEARDALGCLVDEVQEAIRDALHDLPDEREMGRYREDVPDLWDTHTEEMLTHQTELGG